MLESHFNFCIKLNSIYLLEDKEFALRKAALVLTSFIPLLLLFSRAIADIALTTTGILFVTYCIRAQYYSYIKQPIVITLILLWLWFMITSLFAFSNNTQAFFMSFVYIRFILFFIACAYWLFTDIKAFQFASIIITITLIIAASDALFQFISGFSISGKPQWGARLTGLLRRPDIGIYLAKLIFPIASLWISLAINFENKKNLFLSYLFLLLTITVIFLTGERTATVLSLFALTSSLLIIAIYNKNLRAYTLTTIVSVIGLLTWIIYKVPFIYQRLMDFMNDVSNFPNSLYGQLFKASILSWYKYGIFTGVGIRQFRNSCLTFKTEGLVTYCDIHSHNIYLEILSESGAIGFSLFVIFVLLCLRQVIVSATINSDNFGKFVSCIFAFAGLITILFPIIVTMSFITNWSGTLNWTGISLCFSALLLNSKNSKISS